MTYPAEGLVRVLRRNDFRRRTIGDTTAHSTNPARTRRIKKRTTRYSNGGEVPPSALLPHSCLWRNSGQPRIEEEIRV